MKKFGTQDVMKNETLLLVTISQHEVSELQAQLLGFSHCQIRLAEYRRAIFVGFFKSNKYLLNNLQTSFQTNIFNSVDGILFVLKEQIQQRVNQDNTFLLKQFVCKKTFPNIALLVTK